MKIAMFSAKPYDESFFNEANHALGHEITFFNVHLNEATTQLAAGFPVVCVFPNDTLNRSVLQTLAAQGTKLIALRCAGYNNVDLDTAYELGLTVVRVPDYSPHAVAEHTIAMMLCLNRKIHRAYNRVREGNFKLDGLLGFDLHGKTVGIVGTGQIGSVVANILSKGFGCRVIAYDPSPTFMYEEGGIHYMELDELFSHSDIISLHCPLTPHTYHLIDDRAINLMKPGVMIINTSRGGVIETAAIIKGLKSGKIGSLGLDVYEEEADLFFEDFSDKVMKDDLLARLLTFQNVLITAHQAFFTQEAMTNIAHTTLSNISAWEAGNNTNQVLSITAH